MIQETVPQTWQHYVARIQWKSNMQRKKKEKNAKEENIVDLK